MKQQLIALALSTALLAGSAAAIAPEEAFPAVNTYPGFADVAGSAWYAATVQTCYEVGLMTGTGTGFAPDQVLTVGESMIFQRDFARLMQQRAVWICSVVLWQKAL